MISAPGKVILFGEHAVVYGRPAIAAPVTQTRAVATVRAASSGSGLALAAHDLDRLVRLSNAVENDPLAAAARLTLDYLDADEPDIVIDIQSSIPIASGMGSGAAVSTAIVRTLAACLGRDLPPATVSDLVYQVEKIHHGTPSGIDNMVVAYEQPVYFVRGQALETLAVGAPLYLLIADTGIASSTRLVVQDVRRAWQTNKAQYEALFDWIAGIVGRARACIQAGDVAELGPLMNENHALLREMEISLPELDHLVRVARKAGALGAKLSGGGRGGNVIVLVDRDDQTVARALLQAGAVRVIETIIDKGGRDDRTVFP